MRKLILYLLGSLLFISLQAQDRNYPPDIGPDYFNSLEEKIDYFLFQRAYSTEIIRPDWYYELQKEIRDSGDPAFNYCKEVLFSTDDYNTAWVAATFLSEINSNEEQKQEIRQIYKGILDGSIKVANNERNLVEISIIQTLNDFGTSKDAEYLIPMLNHNNPGIRNSCLWALSKIGDSRAIEAIESAMAEQKAQLSPEEVSNDYMARKGKDIIKIISDRISAAPEPDDTITHPDVNADTSPTEIDNEKGIFHRRDDDLSRLNGK